jgi:excisionase family DNA binding protein
MPDPKAQLLTPSDVAERCQVCTKTVLRAIQRGRLRASRLGARGAYRIRTEDLDAWVSSSLVRPRDSAADLAPQAPLTLTADADEMRDGTLRVTSEMGRR